VTEIFDEYCLRCGYPLCELVEPRCPECGLVATEAGIQEWLVEHRGKTVRVLALVYLWLILYMVPNGVLSGTVDRLPRHGLVTSLLTPCLAIPLLLLLTLVVWAMSYSKDYLLSRLVMGGRKLLLVWIIIHSFISVGTFLI